MSHPHDLPDDEQLFDLLLGQAAPVPTPAQTPPPAPARDETALSNFQQRLWLVQQMDTASTAYLMPFHLRLRGPLDRPALQRALQLLWRRHDALRTIYPVQGGLPRCARLPAAPLELREFDFSSAPDRWREHYLTTVFGPMNLGKGPLVRASLYQLAPEEHLLLVDIHHLNGDGASLTVLQEELFAAYAAYVRGQEPNLPPPGADYADFVQHQQTRTGRATEDLARHLRSLEDAPRQIDFLFDLPLPERFNYKGTGHTSVLQDLQPLRRAFAQGRTLGLSPFMVGLTALGAMIHRHTGQDILLIGTPLSVRDQPRFARTVGFFVNTCVARLDFAGDPTLAEAMQRTRWSISEMLQHPEVQLDELVNALCRQRPTDRPPLVQATLSFLSEESGPAPELPDGLRVEPINITRDSAMFELTLDLILRENHALCYLECYRGGFTEESARRFFVHFQQILAAIASDPHTRVSSIPLFDQKAVAACRASLTGPAIELPPATLDALIRQHALRTPAAPALVSGDTLLTFAQLAQAVSARRGQLASAGLVPGAVLALACATGLDWVVTTLAALECGAAVLPLDADAPAERLGGILENAGAALLWHDDRLSAEKLAALPDCRRLTRAAPSAPAIDAPSLAAPERTAYLIYTSGTTGQPKGVRVSHAAIAAHVRSAATAYGYTPADRTLAFAPTHFDAFWEQLFTPLCAGASVLLRESDLWAPNELFRRAQRHAVTVLDLPPQYLRETLFFLKTNPGAAPDRLRIVIAGGEALPSALATEWQDGPLGELPLLNAYGPTEAVVTATVHRIEKGTRTATANGIAPIGFPLPGRELRLLDAQGREVGEGIAGELYLGGIALADGYHGDDARTAERFPHWVRNPAGGRFCEPGVRGSIRLYRTGDRARIGPDGAIEFLGRLDQQLKIRGFRIEPGEIESVLTRHPSVAQAFVTALEDPAAGPQLVAYVLPRDGSAIATTELADWLARWLPESMRPAALVPVDRFPTTASGKIDATQLPRPTLGHTPAPATTSRPPAGELEARIASIWGDVLGRRDIGASDNFFDLGGHSLLLVRVHTRLVAELGTPIRLVDLFANPTIAQQARLLRGDDRTASRRRQRTLRGDIAVVGMAGRFPGADTVDELWQNLAASRESIRFFTQEELAEAGIPESLRTNPHYVPAHGFLGGEECFDAAFFGYTPHEAALIDPQQRFFLEECWHALESAGCDPDRYAGDIGVYGGMGLSLYLVHNLTHLLREDRGAEAFAASLGADKDFIASRVCYKLNLRGPGVNINTACSTSLVAIHTAAQALLNGECDMALAGGVTLSLPAKSGYLYEPGGIASPDGHCRAFAADATGTVGGSGCAVVCLMRLEDALAGGHPIRAVLKGSAINNDGSDKVGFTAPGVRRQRDVIRAALDHAGLGARDIQMIEAHGTGTPMGDPIEVQALSDAFADDEVAPQSCWIGSLKTNIGHLDTAAGAASFIKAVLALEHGLIPASLHCATPSAKIDFPRTPFRVAQSTMPWPAGRRRAAVSSFGMGGTNAHAVLEEAPPRPQSAARGRWCLPLSARSESSLLAQARALAAWLGAHPEANPADLLRTFVAGRRRFAVRAVVFADRCEDAAQRLDQLQPADLLRCDREGRVLSGTGLAGAMPDEFAELSREWLTGDLAKATAALPAGANLVPLPGYAFERTRHWIDAQPTHGAATSTTATTADTPTRLPLENCLRYPAWEDLPRLRETVEDLPALAIVTHGGESTAHWLDRSRAAGLAGSVYGSSEALERAAQAGTLPTHVLHLGALEATGSVASRLARLLADVRAIAASGGKRTLTLLHPGLEDDPAIAYLDAARSVIPHEYASLTVRVLRVPSEPGVADFRAIRATALAETDDRHLAIRNGRRQRLIHAALPGLTAAAGAARLRNGGVYVITGGFGGIGLTLARELATRCQPRLYLFARHEPGAEETAALHDLETRGARVTTAVLDVADATAVKAFFAQIRTTEGRIDGVIHAAGVGGGSLIARTGEAEFVPVLRAKIDGTRALTEALGDAPLDFVALCSSLTAVLGGPGQIAYATANAWMDAFAQSRAAAGQPWFSIRWDTWAEVGMAARPFVAEITGRTLREWTVSPATYWPWGEHRIDGHATLPGTAYLELLALALGGQTQASFVETTLMEPLVHDGETTRTLHVIENAGELSFVSGSGAQQRVHARARRAAPGATSAAEPLEAIRQRCTQPVARLAESAPTIAIEASPRWQLDARCLRGRDEALLELALDERYAGDLAEHPWHPALLDVALSFYIDLVDGGTATLPWRYDSVQLFAPLARRIVSHARLVSHSERAVVLDLAVYSETGKPLAIVKGLTLIRATAPAARTPARSAAAPANPFALTPEEGTEVFLRALASAEPVVEVCTTEWRFAEHIATPVTAATPAAAPVPSDTPATGRQPRPESAGTYIAPTGRAQQIVAQAWAEVLGYNRIGAEDDLIDIGADSLIALQASAQLEKLTGRKMPMAKFFEKPTVAHIAKAYADLLPETVTPAAPSQWEEGEL